jgi:type IV fimbrial biogenesis protein FimT
MATADVTLAKSRGFTLIELMAALAILALLFLLGMPSFTTFIQNSKVRSTSESIVNGLRTASAEATRRNSRVAFTFTGGGASWQIKAISDPATDTDCTNFAADVIQQFATEEARSGAKVTVTPAGKSAVCFTGLGRVFNAGAGDHIRQIDVEPAAAGSEGRKLRIIVDDPAPTDPAKPRGLRMCDPDPALAALSPPDPRAC